MSASTFEHEMFPCADARRVLLKTMREVRKVSDEIGRLAEPWEIIGVIGLDAIGHAAAPEPSRPKGR